MLLKRLQYNYKALSIVDERYSNGDFESSISSGYEVESRFDYIRRSVLDNEGVKLSDLDPSGQSTDADVVNRLNEMHVDIHTNAAKELYRRLLEHAESYDREAHDFEVSEDFQFPPNTMAHHLLGRMDRAHLDFEDVVSDGMETPDLQDVKQLCCYELLSMARNAYRLFHDVADMDADEISGQAISSVNDANLTMQEIENALKIIGYDYDSLDETGTLTSEEVRKNIEFCAEKIITKTLPGEMPYYDGAEDFIKEHAKYFGSDSLVSPSFKAAVDNVNLAPDKPFEIDYSSALSAELHPKTI